VFHNPLNNNWRGFDDSTSPSANIANRDILFPAAGAGRNPAEFGLFWPFIRTTYAARKAHFGPLSVSVRRVSLT
jgi:hypothetical protein